MAISNLTKPQLNVSSDREHQESKEGGEKNYKGKQESKYRQQHASSSAGFVFISASTLQVL